MKQYLNMTRRLDKVNKHSNPDKMGRLQLLLLYYMPIILFKACFHQIVHIYYLV